MLTLCRAAAGLAVRAALPASLHAAALFAPLLLPCATVVLARHGRGHRSKAPRRTAEAPRWLPILPYCCRARAVTPSPPLEAANGRDKERKGGGCWPPMRPEGKDNEKEGRDKEREGLPM